METTILRSGGKALLLPLVEYYRAKTMDQVQFKFLRTL